MGKARAFCKRPEDAGMAKEVERVGGWVGAIASYIQL